MVIPAAIIFAAIYYSIAYHLLKRRVAGLDRHELWLPRRERRAYARKELQRKDDERTQEIIERTTNFLKGEPQPHEK